MSRLESAVSDSGRLTLFYRTHYFRHFANQPDLAAEAVVRKLGHWPEIFKTPIANFNSLNLGRRARLTDQIILGWLETNRQGLILNLGCGLDTVFQRLPQDRWEGLSLDHADVIAVRDQLGLNLPNTRSVAATLADLSWLDELPRERKAIIILNGVLPYLEAKVSYELLARINSHFDDALLVFDTTSRIGKWITNASIWVHQLNDAFFRSSEVNLPKLDLVERFNLSDFSEYAELDWMTRSLGLIAWALRLNSLYVVQVRNSR